MYLFPSSFSLLTSQNRTTNDPMPVIYNNCHQPDLFTSCNLLVATLILGINKINSAKFEIGLKYMLSVFARNIFSKIIAEIVIKKQNIKKYQYSDRLARP